MDERASVLYQRSLEPIVRHLLQCGLLATMWSHLERFLRSLARIRRDDTVFLLLVFYDGAVCSYTDQVCAHLILLSNSVALIAITPVLWWAYHDIKPPLDSTPFAQLLEKAAKNEPAFLVFAIVSTIITVILLLVVGVMWKRMALVSALLKEASNCIRNNYISVSLDAPRRGASYRRRSLCCMAEVLRQEQSLRQRTRRQLSQDKQVLCRAHPQRWTNVFWI